MKNNEIAIFITLKKKLYTSVWGVFFPQSYTPYFSSSARVVALPYVQIGCLSDNSF